MKYDFTTVLDRNGHDIIAADIIPFDAEVEEGFSTIPMWIADMSFPVAPCIDKAIRERMEFPNFGYFSEPDEYFDSIISWHKLRKGVNDLTKECIGYENGVLGGVSSAITAFTCAGEKILLSSPTYVGFTHVLEDLGRPAVHSELVRDENGVWRMDFEDMDAKIKENNIHLAIFCSPHNPCGRVWERWEIEKAMEVFKANDCIVVSDEIWSDIIMPGFTHIPTQSVSEDAKQRTIAFYAPSKTFSLAGLVGSYHVVYNKYLRDRLLKQSGSTHYNAANVLSVSALTGAYSPEGMEWADEMIKVIELNLDYACGFIAENFEGVRVMRPQGTYMLFLDCGEWCKVHGVSADELRKRGVKKGVIWQNGDDFFLRDSIRMNFALPRSLAIEAMERLKKYVFI